MATINDPVEDYALAVCDASTIDYNNLVAVDHVTRSHIGETLYCMYDSRAKWYYAHRQRPDEVMLLKIYDSDESYPARCTNPLRHILYRFVVHTQRAGRLTCSSCPHTAFRDEAAPDHARPRRSIEVRAIVCTNC